MNGNGKTNNGRLFHGRFSKVDDVILKIGAGVATIFLIAIVSFGMKVYAFMEAGDRFTPEMHSEWEEMQRQNIEEHYVQKDVYSTDLNNLKDRLDRIEDKQDKILAELRK